MKNLLFYLLIAACVPLLGSCSSYYYSTLSSSDREGDENMKEGFIQENDTVRISYNFYGENAPVSITIYNKLNEPLFVDWTRSSLIIDDEATSYYNESVAIQGNIESDSYSDMYRWGRRTSSTYGGSVGTFSGEVTLPKGISFIPPRSKVNKSSLMLSNLPFDNIPKKEYTKVGVPKVNNEVVNVLIKEFTEEDSPVRFRSYLTLYADNPDTAPMTFERSFYVSRLMKTGNLSPSNVWEAQQKQPDFFYVHTVKGGETATLIGVIAIGVVVDVALDAMEH